jgi:hypothetical protein
MDGLNMITTPNTTGVQALSDEQIEAAAKVISDCMDYPWAHMPEQGRSNMRKHAAAVVAAALAGQEQAGAVAWRDMATAPKDGTLLRLLVDFEHHATEDGEGPQPTIGSNTWDNHHDFDEWQFAGWNWEQDCYTQGIGKPVGWLPMLEAAPGAAIAAREQEAAINPAVLHEVLGYAAHWAAFEEKRGNTLNAQRVCKVIASLASRREAPDTPFAVTPAAPSKVVTYYAESVPGSQHDTGRVYVKTPGKSHDNFFASASSLEDARSIADAMNAPLTQPTIVQPFQARVQPWLMACFGEMIAGDREERNHRFIEEALELVQACGCTASEAHQLVDYVFARPVGEKSQEVGGVMVTLAALCLAQDLDMAAAGETELARIWTKVEQIRAKQAAKPKHSPLPAAVTIDDAPLETGEGDAR